MTVDASIPFDALREIRDRALMLSLGKSYLCESPFLKKYGAELEHALDVLGRDIKELKKSFPGKFADEVDTDRMLQGMEELIRRLKSPDETLEQECTIGQLGQDLEDRLTTLINAIKGVQSQVDGRPAAYSGREAVSATVSRMGDAARGGLGMVGKIIGMALVALVVAFGCLFLTMEREGSFENEIERGDRKIRALQEEVAALEERMQPIEDRITNLDRLGTTRMDKVRMMELSVELQELEKEAQSFRGEIEMEERRIQEAREALLALQEKSFFQRLFRQ